MSTKLEFKRPCGADAHIMAPYFSMRPNKTCDSGLLDTFIWRDHYNIRACIADEKAVLTLMDSDGETFTMLPWCSEEDLPRYFALMERYFNEELHLPLLVYSADEEGVQLLGVQDDPRYLVQEAADYRDYLYSGDGLRTLAGKKYHQKKNQVNKFRRMYEGRWEYRTLTCADRPLVLEFLIRWYAQHEDQADEDMHYERQGIGEILQDCCKLCYKMGGIFIDGTLQAMSMGTLNPRESMAVISVEKADPRFPGLYQMINQEFLLHEFPEAELVNREDDMGHPGLRQAKESYQPIGFARKYTIRQLDFEPSSRMRFLFRLEEKQATRALYDRTFEDSRAYTDLYYNEKCRGNVIVVKEEGEEILSMAHLNPYQLSVRSLPVQTFMLAAVATVPERRREGHMRDVLNAAFDWLAEQGVPFVILLPVDPAIYQEFGFEPICDFSSEEPAFGTLEAEYDVYILPDPATKAYRAMARAVEEALQAAGEKDEDWPDMPVMARVTDAAAFDRMAGQTFESDAARLAWLRGLKICISEGV